MGLVVLKFGGSSLATTDRIKRVAERVAARVADGDRVVVVVSAMQGETDRLMGLAKALQPSPNLRELDQLLATGEQSSAALLSLALAAMHYKARSFSAAQLRLMTDGNFNRARLRALDSQRIQQALAQGEIVVATGFQGVDAHDNLTTLGRGGSDTTAVALAASLRADACEIFTDVDGVFTADPRICKQARKRNVLRFAEMLEMASLGSKVLQIRSVELAMNHNIALCVRSSFNDTKGTLVSNSVPIEHVNVVAISHSADEAELAITGLPFGSGALSSLFTKLSQDQINVDVIVQSQPKGDTVDVAFTVARVDLHRAQQSLKALGPILQKARLQSHDDVGKVSIVGVGMMSHPGVAAQMFQTLHQHDIRTSLISTSEIKVTCVIARKHVARAVNALHEAFNLAQRPSSKACTDDSPV